MKLRHLLVLLIFGSVNGCTSLQQDQVCYPEYRVNMQNRLDPAEFEESEVSRLVRGYVLELRQCDSGNMVRVAFRDKGTKVSTRDVFLFKSPYKNGSGQLEFKEVGKGFVVDDPVNAVSSKYAWVAIEDELVPHMAQGLVAERVLSECEQLALEGFSCPLDNSRKINDE